MNFVIELTSVSVCDFRDFIDYFSLVFYPFICTHSKNTDASLNANNN